MSSIERYTAPSEGYRAIAELTRPTLDLVSRRIAGRALLAGIREFDIENPEGEIERARSMVDRLPPLPELAAQCETLEAALRLPATEEQVAPVVAALVGAMPTAGKGATRSYLEAILVESTAEESDENVRRYMGSRGLSVFVIAAAARRIVRTEAFLPTVARLIEVSHMVRREVWEALCVTRAMARLRRDAETVIRMIDVPLPADPDEVPF